MSLAQVETYMTAAVAALQSGDHATALTHALSAQGLLSVIPDAERSGTSYRWTLDRVDKFVANLRKMQVGGSGGIQRTKVTYTNVEEAE
jgi:hypothetical protein